jgi:hypothetical protein
LIIPILYVSDQNAKPSGTYGPFPAENRADISTVSRQVERALLLRISYTDAVEIALLIMAVGAVGPAYLLAKRVRIVLPLGFIAACVLAVGAITFAKVVVFGMVDVKWRQMPVRAWLDVYWTLWTILCVPSVAFALLACWFSRPSTWRDAAVLLGVYLFLILVAVGAALVLRLQVGFWFLVVGPSMIFFAMALVKRVAQDRRHRLSRTQPVCHFD